MRQVIDNPKLATRNVPKFSSAKLSSAELSLKLRCTKRVTSCSAKTATGQGTDWCHQFYKCIETKDEHGQVVTVAYSCQNPKLLSRTCSAKYYFNSMEKYRCVPPTLDDNWRCKSE